jgi:hypothetical protein
MCTAMSRRAESKCVLERGYGIAPGIRLRLGRALIDPIKPKQAYHVRSALAAGHNDPIIGQGLSIALRDVRLVSEILVDAKAAGREPDFRPYVEERAERMRRLRITAQVVTTLRVEFGEEARERRARVGKRVAAGQLAPLRASMIGPDRLLA